METTDGCHCAATRAPRSYPIQPARSHCCQPATAKSSLRSPRSIKTSGCWRARRASLDLSLSLRADFTRGRMAQPLARVRRAKVGICANRQPRGWRRRGGFSSDNNLSIVSLLCDSSAWILKACLHTDRACAQIATRKHSSNRSSGSTHGNRKQERAFHTHPPPANKLPASRTTQQP